MQIGLIGTGFRRDDPNAIPAELDAVLATGTDVRIFPPRLSAFPNNQLDLAAQELGYLDAGITAADAGCDALVINSFGDYGLAALKSATRKPAIGAGESGLYVASMIGRPFAVVTIWPESTKFLYRKVIQESGLASQCQSVLHVGTQVELSGLGEEEDYIHQMQGGDPSLLKRILGKCHDAIEGGATAILLGCTCMSPVADKIRDSLDVPVINPLTTSVKQAEMFATLGLRQSSANFAAAHPSRKTLISAMASTGADMAGAEDCEYCIVSEEMDA